MKLDEITRDIESIESYEVDCEASELLVKFGKKLCAVAKAAKNINTDKLANDYAIKGLDELREVLEDLEKT